MLDSAKQEHQSLAPKYNSSSDATTTQSENTSAMVRPSKCFKASSDPRHDGRLPLCEDIRQRPIDSSAALNRSGHYSSIALPATFLIEFLELAFLRISGLATTRFKPAVVHLHFIAPPFEIKSKHLHSLEWTVAGCGSLGHAATKVVEVSIYARIIELESTAECFRKLSKLGSERAARSLTSFGGAADEKSN
ncbi:hypothetical protein J7T55_011420 [Diaporthe amygdali]|uniref:uncharacterized protein n=1 Tax=Phomopsis amygdali TaxID=1214568 RepID=UPI0022FDE4EF|nr:uncharacterized protein J7T55_011420 [Diaporthe amygdali]KAJ0122959.1 hypothetical protein J7T55_011420 [Diaporthe amygdali]